MATPERTRLIRDEGNPPRWEIAVRAPPPQLRPYVRDYYGYTERTAGPLRRRELPSLQAVLIFDFGPPLRLIEADEERAVAHAGGFVAGVGDSFTITEHDGFSHGMQVNLTPIGARLFLGLPMLELSNRTLSFQNVFKAEDRGLPQRLHEARGWDARFDLLDRALGRTLGRAGPATACVAWAVARIERSGGQVDIGELVRATGYSHKHLIHLFRDQVGLPPRLVARLVRFDGVVQRLKRGIGGSWAQIAAEHGFADQAHLVREIRHFTGLSPGAARAGMAFDIPRENEVWSGGGEVNSVQEGAAGLV